MATVAVSTLRIEGESETSKKPLFLKWSNSSFVQPLSGPIATVQGSEKFSLTLFKDFFV